VSVCYRCKTDSPGPRFEVWIGPMFERTNEGWMHDNCDKSNREEIARLLKRATTAEEAARWCWNQVSCQTVHHPTRHEHECYEPCPVLQSALKKWPFLGDL